MHGACAPSRAANQERCVGGRGAGQAGGDGMREQQVRMSRSHSIPCLAEHTRTLAPKPKQSGSLVGQLHLEAGVPAPQRRIQVGGAPPAGGGGQRGMRRYGCVQAHALES